MRKLGSGRHGPSRRWAGVTLATILVVGCGSDDSTSEIPGEGGLADRGRTEDAREAGPSDGTVRGPDARVEAAADSGDARAEAATDAAIDGSTSRDGGTDRALDASDAANARDGAADVTTLDAPPTDASRSPDGSDAPNVAVDAGRDGAIDAALDAPSQVDASDAAASATSAEAASDAAVAIDATPVTDAPPATDAALAPDAPANCTDGPFITNTVTLRDVTSSELLSGATVKANVCGEVATTNASGVAALQLPRGMESWLRFDAAGKIPTILQARTLVADQNEARVIFNDTYRQAYFPDYDANQAEILVTVARAGTASPCTTSDGATISVVGHPEAVVTYWQGGLPNEKAVGATATTLTGTVTITGIPAGTQVFLDVQKPGCGVFYDYLSSASPKLPLETGAVTYVVPILQN